MLMPGARDQLILYRGWQIGTREINKQYQFKKQQEVTR